MDISSNKEQKEVLKKLIDNEISIRKRWEKCAKEFENIINDSKLNNTEYHRWWIVNMGNNAEALVSIGEKSYRIKPTEKTTFDEKHAPVGIEYEDIKLIKL